MSDELTAAFKAFERRTIPTFSKEVPLYEIGTFTPTFAGSGGGATWTYTVQTGFYTRIGNRCFFNLSLFTSARAGVPLATAVVTNLPFTPTATANSHSPCAIDSIDGFTLTATTTQLSARVPPGLPWVEFVENKGTAPTVAALLAAGALNAAIVVRISGHYIIA